MSKSIGNSKSLSSPAIRIHQAVNSRINCGERREKWLFRLFFPLRVSTLEPIVNVERHIFLIFARPETAYLPRFVFISNSDDGSDRAFEPDLQTGKEELSGAGKVGARRAETG